MRKRARTNYHYRPHQRARKHRVDRVLILPIYRALQRLCGARVEAAEVVLAITPTFAASNPKCPEDSSP